MLVEMLDRKTLVALAIKPLHFLRPVGRDPLARRLAEPAVDKPSLALLTRQRRVQRRNVRSLTPSTSAAPPGSAPPIPSGSEGSKTPSCAPPEGLLSDASNPSKKGRTYRTDRALPKPDISSATDTLSDKGLLEIRNGVKIT